MIIVGVTGEAASGSSSSRASVRAPECNRNGRSITLWASGDVLGAGEGRAVSGGRRRRFMAGLSAMERIEMTSRKSPRRL